MAGNVRISTENMDNLRRQSKGSGVNIQFLVNKMIGEHYSAIRSDEFSKPHDARPVDVANSEVAIVVKAKAPVKRFAKPEFAELSTYFQVKGSLTCNDDAQGFLDHFNSNGWKVGGKAAMKDWKAAARNWMRNKKKQSTQAFGQNSDSTRNLTLEEELNDTSWAK